jgi:dUTP pyrophosphatase
VVAAFSRPEYSIDQEKSMFRQIEARIVNPLLGTRIDLPSYATDGSAAMDLRAAIASPITLEPGCRILVATGIAINMMDPGMVAIVASRSGLSLKHGIRVAQGIGVIDADYHGEIAVILANDSLEPYVVNPGDRIAQLMFQPVVQVSLRFVDAFQTETARGVNGFGSTGKQ